MKRENNPKEHKPSVYHATRVGRFIVFRRSYFALPISRVFPPLPIPHPHRLEREFAKENIRREPGANEHETHGLCEGKITYELALERELEYRKRLKDAGLQTFATNRVPPTPPQKLPLEHNLKRKVMSGVHTESVPTGSHSPRLPLQDWQVESRKLHSQQPLTKRLNCYRTLTQHSPQRLNCSQHPDQMFKHRPHLQHQHGCQPPLHRNLARQINWPRQSNQPAVNNQGKFYRCNLCQMNFDTSSKLHLHYQTKEHNARHKFTNINVPNGSTVVWCEECRVPCMNETLLAQHRAGKKHAACLRLLAQSATSTAAGAGQPPRI
ncbi:uncharacterized protein LOC122002152 isoform X2 [Zingiber officinale]|uniref:uncharacterized protein LOC122002152 isoform X2 n=1 Tax=Zingiber officinale TaxID=94328 RepID=UPI001C4C2454|nr:uncharacterized protein LOC122002152 isoform X2 [Zingiber officinale]